MAYTRYHSPWHDWPTTDTPVTAASLDHIEAGIESAASTADTASTDAASALAVGNAAVPKSTVTTNGDLIVGTGAGTIARLGVGAAGTVLKGGTTPAYSSIVNADVSASAAIAYAKLALALSVVNGDISASAAIARSKLDFGSGLVNADIAAAAAIALSKLAGYPTDATKFARGDGTWAVPPSGAMVQLYDNTAGGAIASWDVTAGLTGYNHLKIVCMGRGDTASASVAVVMRFNNDTAANYSSQRVGGVAATASAAEVNSTASPVIGAMAGASATANHAGGFEATVPNYAGTTFFKGAYSYGGFASALTTTNLEVDAREIVWASTAAITRITILPTAGNFIAGSRLTIYGML